MSKQLLIAHRGYSSKYPENTMKAFDEAFNAGFDGIEFDTHMTKDGHLVVIHDDSIDRTSDMTGLVRDLTLEEIREANFAHNTEFPKETIMTLEEFFARYQNKFPWFNLEVKTDDFPYEGIEEKVSDLIVKYKLFTFGIITFSSYLRSHDYYIAGKRKH